MACSKGHAAQTSGIREMLVEMSRVSKQLSRHDEQKLHHLVECLKQHLKKYNDDHENDTLRTNVDNEVQELIKMADEKRKSEDLQNQVMKHGSNNEESKV